MENTIGKHTRGIWKVVEVDKFFQGAIICAYNDDIHGDFICQLSTCKGGEEGIANAYLIASAPDLLDACKQLLHLLYEKGIRPLNENSPMIKAQKLINFVEGNHK